MYRRCSLEKLPSIESLGIYVNTYIVIISHYDAVYLLHAAGSHRQLILS